MAITEILPIIVRNPSQLGHALLRYRRATRTTQAETGLEAGIKQGAVSTIESGTPGTRLSTLFKLLAALNLELVVRPRPKGSDGPAA